MGMLRKSGIISESSALPNPIPSENLQHWVEHYSNHLGATDNFTATQVSGAGSAATADTTNHEMDLTTGLTTNLGDYSLFKMKKTFTPPTAGRIIATAIINNAVASQLNKFAFVGFKADPTSYDMSAQDLAVFYLTNGTWKAAVNDGSTLLASDALSVVQDGDILTIVLTASKVQFYINGVNVYTATTSLPNAAMLFFGGVDNENGSNNAATTLSVDYMAVDRYLL